MPSGENEILVYSEITTNRLRYILDFLGREFGVTFSTTNEKDQFVNFTGPRICYSESSITSGSFHIKPSGLLSRSGIDAVPIECFIHNGQKAFFKTGGDHPFDILSAIFYLITRYEEYLPHNKDEYGRYDHRDSLASREGFLHLPLINLWLKDFTAELSNKFPSIQFRQRVFRFLPTYDIDEAYSFRHKQWWRTVGGITRSVLQGRFSSVIERTRVLNGKKKDPFDSYKWMHELHERYNLDPVYFFHVGLSNGRYDKNILPSKKALKNLVRQHAEKYTIGVHPSWKSNDPGDLLKLEILKLTHLAGKQVTHSRQHFIKFHLPQTYRRLVDNDIRHDFSMGYGSINGFRASIASSFYWYDLEKEVQADLLVHPFCYMDANSYFEKKQTPEQAFYEMLEFYKVIREVNGTMITIWHNTFLGTSKLFEGWREVYEKFIASIH